MPCQSYWLIEYRILYTELSGLLTLEDIKTENQKLLAMMDEGMAPIHHVAYGAQLERYPLNFRIIADAMTFTQREIMGWQIGVAMSPKLQGVIKMAAQTSRLQMLFSPTVQEALYLLRDLDKTLHLVIEPRKPKATGALAPDQLP